MLACLWLHLVETLTPVKKQYGRRNILVCYYFSDFDECTGDPPHQQCQDQCINVVGSYRCACHTGYRLADDGLKCAGELLMHSHAHSVMALAQSCTRSCSSRGVLFTFSLRFANKTYIQVARIARITCESERLGMFIKSKLIGKPVKADKTGVNKVPVTR